jgi:hypothetical protein
MISRTLPSRYAVASGFVITEQEASSQIDVLIYDTSVPVLYKGGDLVFVQPSACAAVIEVKSRLNATTFRDAVNKLAAVCDLIHQHERDTQLFSGIFAYEGNGGAGRALMEHIADAAEGESRRVVNRTPRTVASGYPRSVSGARPFLADALEECIAEHAVGLGRSVEMSDARIEAFRRNKTRRYRRLANALDHRGERLPRETVDQVRSARIHVRHPRRDTDRIETRLDQQRVELSADQRVAAGLPLQLNLALDCRTGGGAIGMEAARPVIALDNGDCAAGPEESLENRQGLNRPREVLEHEADENMVEGLGVEGQGEDVRLPEFHVGESIPVGPSLGFDDRVCADIDRRESCVRAPLGQGDRLGADAAPGLEHPTPARVRGVGVQQVDQRSSLMPQALVLPRVIAVYISFVHGPRLPSSGPPSFVLRQACVLNVIANPRARQRAAKHWA